jgi:hypothetical protein
MRLRRERDRELRNGSPRVAGEAEGRLRVPPQIRKTNVTAMKTGSSTALDHSM